MKTRSLRRKRLFGNLLTYCIVAAAFVILQLLNAGGMLSPSLQGQLVPICAYVTMAVALNLVVGISGELSLGHAGFMSVGAFSGVVASISLQELIPMGPLRLLVSMLIGAFFAGIAGVIVGVPVLRLRGDYLAIVTLAFGEIIKNIINILYVGVDENGLHFSTSSEAALNLSETGKAILKGPMGVTANVKLSSFTAGFLLVMVALIVVLNLVNSRSGRAIMALRDNRIAAESVGIGATKYKLMAFTVGAFWAGMVGTLFAANIRTIEPTSFNFYESVILFAIVILGGSGSIAGVVLGAFLLIGLQDVFREFESARMLIFGAAMMVMMIICPQGLLPPRRRFYNARFLVGRFPRGVQRAEPAREEAL